MKPVGVVDRVKGKLREMFTPKGRAEVMAQKQIDTILAKFPEEKRVEAMILLEQKRPELVAGKMEEAKGSMVRDAAIGAAAAGTVAVGLGVGYWQRKRIGKGVDKVGETLMGKLSFDNQVKVASAIQNVNDFRARVDQGVNKIRDRIAGLWRKPSVPDIKVTVGESTSPPIRAI